MNDKIKQNFNHFHFWMYPKAASNSRNIHFASSRFMSDLGAPIADMLSAGESVYISNQIRTEPETKLESKAAINPLPKLELE
jgi:hypothetical protein